MREILFRGKTNKNMYGKSNWVEGFLVPRIHKHKKCYFINNEIIIPTDGVRYYSYLVCEESIGQYTGMCDRNGKRIFEGDVLVCDEKEFGLKQIEVVVWDYDIFSLRKNDWNEKCVVIGNVYDNPELLEGE